MKLTRSIWLIFVSHIPILFDRHHF